MYDAYSKYLAVAKLANKSSTEVVKELRKVFGYIGYPTVIRADNNPFGSEACRTFARSCNIRLILSSPRFPQSNGLAEKGVAIAKGILQKAVAEGKADNFEAAVLEYNCSRVASMGIVPAVLFFGRQLKTTIPVAEPVLCRKEIIPECQVQKAIFCKRLKQKRFFDRGARDLKRLAEGDTVRFRLNSDEWMLGKVEREVSPRSYFVIDSRGRRFRRNRRHIVRQFVRLEDYRDNNCGEDDQDGSYVNDRDVDNDSETNDQGGGDSVSGSNLTDDSGSDNSSRSFQEPAAGETSSQIELEEPELRTRSGRGIRLPEYLRDYQVRKE